MSIDVFLAGAVKRAQKRQEPRECTIEKHFCTYAKARGCLALKLVWLNRRGFPDRTVLCPGAKAFFIEFKTCRTKQALSGPQKQIKKRLESFELPYFICYQIGQAEAILDQFLK